MDLNDNKCYINDLLLNNYYKVSSYFVVDSDTFDNIIAKISYKGITSNVIVLDNNILTATKFVNQVEYFLDIFTTLFPMSLTNTYKYLKIIIDNNPQLINDYFFNTPYNKRIIKNKVYRIIISTFINNSIYIKEIRDYLIKNNLFKKDINLYSDKESFKVIMLLKSIILTNNCNNTFKLLFTRVSIVNKELKYKYNILLRK